MTNMLNQVARVFFCRINYRLRRSRFLNLLIFNSLDKGLVPDAHVDIAVEITARHHILQGSSALCWEDYDVVEVGKLRKSIRVFLLCQSLDFTDVTWMHARIFSNQNGARHDESCLCRV